jgi:alkaline phosphatase D
MHHTAAHRYDPNRAVFGEFETFWEFDCGPLHAGTDARPARILSQQF